MKYRKLDSNGDFTPGVGAFLIDSPDCVAQAVSTRLQLWLGEWFLDTADGTDWAGRVLGERTLDTFELELRGRVLETPNVLRIQSFAYSISGRDLSCQCTIDTTFGTATVVI